MSTDRDPDPAPPPAERPALSPSASREPDSTDSTDSVRRVVRRRDPADLSAEEREMLRRYSVDRPPHHSSDWG